MQPDPADRNPQRAALLQLIRRLRGGRAPQPGPTLDLMVEPPPAPPSGPPFWRFWLWLIDEHRPQQRTGAGALWRLRVHLDPRER